MGFIVFGLTLVIVGFLLCAGSDSPGSLADVEVFGLATGASGALAVLVGMVAHARQVNRTDRLPR